MHFLWQVILHTRKSWWGRAGEVGHRRSIRNLRFPWLPVPMARGTGTRQLNSKLAPHKSLP